MANLLISAKKMNRSGKQYFLTILILLTSCLLYPNISVADSCQQFLGVQVHRLPHRKFLMAVNTLAIRISNQVFETFPEHDIHAQPIAMQLLINRVIESVARDPSQYLAVAQSAQSLLERLPDHSPLTNQQEVAIYMATRAQAPIKFLILYASGFTKAQEEALKPIM